MEIRYGLGVLAGGVHLLSGVCEIVQEFLLLSQLELKTMVLYLIGAIEGEVLVGLLHFDVLILFFLLFVIMTLDGVGLDKVLLHHTMDVHLLIPVFSQLVLNEAREILLLPHFNLSIEGLMAALHLDLLHVQVKDFAVAHFIAAHEHSFSELGRHGGCVDQGKSSFGRGRATRRALITMLSYSIEFLLSMLRVRVGLVDIAVSLISHIVVHNRPMEGGGAYREVLAIYRPHHGVFIKLPD